jgi:hypothetical protein
VAIAGGRSNGGKSTYAIDRNHILHIAVFSRKLSAINDCINVMTPKHLIVEVFALVLKHMLHCIAQDREARGYYYSPLDIGDPIQMRATSHTMMQDDGIYSLRKTRTTTSTPSSSKSKTKVVLRSLDISRPTFDYHYLSDRFCTQSWLLAL